MSQPRCETCRFWRPFGLKHPQAVPQMGNCNALSLLNMAIVSKDYDPLAEYGPIPTTLSQFGCVFHEPKEPNG